jgi:hypothetical protein
MGLLTEISKVERQIDPKLLFTESKEQLAVNQREKILSRGARLFDENYSRYFNLAKLFESENPKDQLKAALTCHMMQKVEEEFGNRLLNEFTTVSSLGTLNPRVLDVVRIFYPNQIATELVDIQPIDGQVGTIFVMTPQFSNSQPSGTVGGVTAGQTIFANPTYYYANEIQAQSMGTGDGTHPTFAITAGQLPIRQGTVQVTTVIGGVAAIAVDNSNGGFTGASVTSGTINYTTGAISITWSTVPDNLASVLLTYQWNSEQNGQAINAIQFNLTNVPVTAKIHPLTFSYSVASGLAASAHLAIDVQDTLAELAGQYMKIERDYNLLYLINQTAVNYASVNAPGVGSPTLSFSAASATYFDKSSSFADIDIKVDEAERIIQTTNGRGGLSWVVCGSNTANVFRRTRGFMAAPVIAPIGAHVIGYLRDGTVPVVKDLLVTPANNFIFGYKGYMAGDSSIILAEWVPIYFTPVFQAPTLTNQQGLMSMYDMFVNRSSYFAAGTITGYAA